MACPAQPSISYFSNTKDSGWLPFQTLFFRHALRKDTGYSEEVIRSALFISDGDLAILKREFDYGDYRDILLAAEQKSGNYGHYFRMPFPEVYKFEKVLEEEQLKLIKEFEDLPEEFYQQADPK